MLRSAPEPGKADPLPELLQTSRERPLTEDEVRLLAEALRRHEPWLEWSGKREKPWFEVEPVALYLNLSESPAVESEEVAPGIVVDYDLSALSRTTH